MITREHIYPGRTELIAERAGCVNMRSHHFRFSLGKKIQLPFPRTKVPGNNFACLFCKRSFDSVANFSNPTSTPTHELTRLRLPQSRNFNLSGK